MSVSILDIVFLVIMLLFFVIGAVCGLVRLVYPFSALSIAAVAAYFATTPLVGLLKNKGLIKESNNATIEILISVGIGLAIGVIVFLIVFFIFRAIKNAVKNSKGLKVVDCIFGAVFYSAVGFAFCVAVVAVLQVVASKNTEFAAWMTEDISKKFGFSEFLLTLPEKLKNLFVGGGGAASSSSSTIPFIPSTSTSTAGTSSEVTSSSTTVVTEFVRLAYNSIRF